MRQRSRLTCSSQVNVAVRTVPSQASPQLSVGRGAHNENWVITLTPTSPRDRGCLAFSLTSAHPNVFVFSQVLVIEPRALHMLEKCG